MQKGGDFARIGTAGHGMPLPAPATDPADVAEWERCLKLASLGDLAILFTNTPMLVTAGPRPPIPGLKSTEADYLRAWVKLIERQDEISVIPVEIAQREFLASLLTAAAPTLQLGSEVYDAARIPQLVGEELTDLVRSQQAALKTHADTFKPTLIRFMKQYEAVLNMGSGADYTTTKPTNKLEYLLNETVVPGTATRDYNTEYKHIEQLMINPKRAMNVLMFAILRIMKMYTDVSKLVEDLKTISGGGGGGGGGGSLGAVDHAEVNKQILVNRMVFETVSPILTLTNDDIWDGWIQGSAPVMQKMPATMAEYKSSLAGLSVAGTAILTAAGADKTYLDEIITNMDLAVGTPGADVHAVPVTWRKTLLDEIEAQLVRYVARTITKKQLGDWIVTKMGQIQTLYNAIMADIAGNPVLNALPPLQLSILKNSIAEALVYPIAELYTFWFARKTSKKAVQANLPKYSKQLVDNAPLVGGGGAPPPNPQKTALDDIVEPYLRADSHTIENFFSDFYSELAAARIQTATAPPFFTLQPLIAAPTVAGLVGRAPATAGTIDSTHPGQSESYGQLAAKLLIAHILKQDPLHALIPVPPPAPPFYVPIMNYNEIPSATHIKVPFMATKTTPPVNVSFEELYKWYDPISLLFAIRVVGGLNAT